MLQYSAYNSLKLSPSFGSVMDKRTYTAPNTDYKYGFNGMEKDDEAKGDGNSYDFGARIYDSRLGRWMTLDPLMAKYPDVTPYAFAGNSPLYFVDPNGKKLVPYDAHSKQVLKEHFTSLFKVSDHNNVISEIFMTAMENNQTIPKKEFRKALRGLKDKDQKALARGYYKLINSDNIVNFASMPKNAAVPLDIITDKDQKAKAANYENVGDFLSDKGGGATGVDLNPGGGLGGGVASAFVIVQDDYDLSTLDVPILDEKGNALDAKNAVNMDKSASKDEQIVHEILGHAFFGTVKRQGQNTNVTSIQVSNMFRRFKNLSIRSGYDHKVTTTEKKPNEPVKDVPEVFKKTKS